jgi:3-dehydroquinate dehydratase
MLAPCLLKNPRPARPESERAWLGIPRAQRLRQGHARRGRPHDPRARPPPRRSVDCRQSSHEGQLVDWLQTPSARGSTASSFNPGAFTHYSIALRDTVAAIKLPVVEGPSIERARARGVSAPLGDRGGRPGQIAGFGPQSYLLGFDALTAPARADRLDGESPPPPGV